MGELLRFGAFELDIERSELRKAGMAVKLTNQPFQVLVHLARNSGNVVSREDLHRQVWGSETFVDFDRNLNVAIAQIRSALNDDADSPRFVQTVPRRGYKFVAPVERVDAKPAVVGRGRVRYRAIAVGIALAMGLTAALLVALNRPEKPGGRIKIAVLPFDRLEGAEVDEGLLDVLADELITQLGQLHADRLGVIARSSIMRYKSRRAPVDQIARELDIDYVLEGTARRENSWLKIMVRLIDARDQTQVWNTGFGYKKESQVDLQSLGASIGAGISSRLFPNAPEIAKLPRATDARAYEEYRQGRLLLYQGNRAAIERAVPRFQEAASIEPRFAGAWAALAESYALLGRMGGKPAEVFPKAALLARRALEIHEANGEAHNALAGALFWHDRKWTDAERHFKRAIAINPSDAAAHHDYAWLLVAGGRTEEGLIALRRALELDPLSRRVNVDAGWLLMQARRFKEAGEQARRALELDPDLGEAIACLGRVLLHQKRYGEARDQLLRVLKDSPLKEEIARMPAEAALVRLHRAWLEESTSLFQTSRVAAWLGEKDRAIETLEKAFAERNGIIPLLKSEAAFDGLRNDPRFEDLVRRAGIP